MMGDEDVMRCDAVSETNAETEAGGSHELQERMHSLPHPSLRTEHAESEAQ